MSGFEALPNAIQVQSNLTVEDLGFDNEEWSDEAALTVVQQDMEAAVTYVQSKGLVTDWNQTDDLYRGYVKPRTWPGSDVARANLSMHVILEVIEKLMPELYLSYFSDKQPFLIEPKGRTTPNAARARGKVLAWALEQSEFKEQIRRCLKSTLQYGFCVGKYGWETYTKTVKTYERAAQPAKVAAGASQITVNTAESDEVKCIPIEITINKP